MIVVYQISRKGGRTVKKILKFIKKNWISVWLVTVIAISAGIAITYAAYT